MIEDSDDTGKVINLNRDDDNCNQDEDYNDDSSDYAGGLTDNDFVSIQTTFSGISSGELDGYELWIACDQGLNIWNDTSKTEITSDYSGTFGTQALHGWTVGSASLPSGLWIEGVSVGEQYVYWRLVLPDGTPYMASDIVAKDHVKFTVVTYVSLETVDFTGTGLDGIEMQDHYQDEDGNNLRAGGEAAGNNDISVAPEWVGDNVDVTSPAWLDDGLDADSDPERNKHALVPKNTRFKVTAIFDIPDQTSNPTGITAWATCGDSNLALASEQSPVTLERIDGKWQGTFQIATAPTSIGILEDYTWTWFISIDNEIINVVNNSTHTVFVCKEAFTGYKPYDWVAWMSSAWVDAASPAPTTDAQIVEAIGTKACDDDATAPVVGVDFNYDSEESTGDSVERLLQEEKGNCFAFARFTQDLLRVQSISADLHAVGASYWYPPHQGDWHFWASNKKDRDGDNGPGLVYYGETFFPDEWPMFTHAFVVYGDRVYDPSMGQTFTGGWQEYFLDLMTRYIEWDPVTFPSTDEPDAESVWIKHAINRPAAAGDDWVKLPPAT